MKIYIENDGADSITLVSRPTLPKHAYDGRFCGECRFFHQHFNNLGNGIFSIREDGHCYPPKNYSHRKEHMTSDKACCWFKSIT